MKRPAENSFHSRQFSIAPLNAQMNERKHGLVDRGKTNFQEKQHQYTQHWQENAKFPGLR